MRKATLGLAMLTLLAGCGQNNPAEEKAEAAHDVAMVERLNKATFQPIIPVPITAQDIASYGLDKPGCSFRKTGQADPLFIAGKDEGFLRVEGELKRYAAKSQSAGLPGGARTTYVGLAGWIDLVRQPDAGTGADDMRWPARIILHDAQERVAFMSDGVMICHT